MCPISFLSVTFCRACRILLAYVVVLVVTNPCSAQEMPPFATSGTVTLKDEIEFEKVKLITYDAALKAATDQRLPLVCCIGCYSNDIILFLTLKGKVILCYLQSKAAPFPEVAGAVVVGLWDSQGKCKRWDVSTDNFNNESYRNNLLFPKKENPQPQPQIVYPQGNQIVYPQVIQNPQIVYPQGNQIVYPSNSRFQNCGPFR